MTALWAEAFIMLILILVAAWLFTNALEHFGQRMGISAGVTGSIFAAIATALPETMVPVLAIVAGTTDKAVNQEISVGAILGAPLMLSTLSISVMAFSVIRQRGLLGKLMPEKTGLVRDLNFFLAAYFFATIAMYVPPPPSYWRAGIGVVLVGIYMIYLLLTCKASKALVSDGHGVKPEEPMALTMIGFKNNFITTLIQLVLGFVLLLVGAKGFINSVRDISVASHVSALLLSLLIIPIATELPEKFNSVLWVRKRKDTLGMGNITGAMVFQGSLLPALGILLTPWQPTLEIQLVMTVTFVAAIWLRLNAFNKGLTIVSLLTNGVFYLLYLGLAFTLK